MPDPAPWPGSPPSGEPHHSVQSQFGVRPETLPAANAAWADTRPWSQRHAALAVAAWAGAALAAAALIALAIVLWRRWRRRNISD